MKNLFFLMTGVLWLFPTVVSAQIYQLPNGDFEQWDNHCASADDEPACWNGFPSSDCGLAFGCALAQTTRHERSTDKRPGSAGQYSCRIFATVVNLMGMIIPANGNITTGRIRIGSMTAADPSNHNATSRPDFAQPFDAKPDSIAFWAKFSCPDSSQYARMTALFHDDYDMHDPVQPGDEAHIIGSAIREFTQTGTWVRYSVPVNYTDDMTATPQYLLMTFTTNKVPGAGSDNDCLWIDDIEMIYNAALADLKINGATIAGFNPFTYSYTYVMPAGIDSMPVVTATAESRLAEVEITQASAANCTATIVVGRGEQTATYRVNFVTADAMSENTYTRFSVFPNPTGDRVNVVLPENTTAAEILIYNVSGQMVDCEKVSGKTVVLDVCSLKPGIYFLFVKCGGVLSGIEKLIKK